MPRREGGKITINHDQMVTAHRRLDLKGFPHCRGEGRIYEMDLEDLLRQKGMTREEVREEIVDFFKEPYLQED